MPTKKPARRPAAASADLGALVKAVDDVARALDALGFNENTRLNPSRSIENNPMANKGALEAHTMLMRKSVDRVADALSLVAKAIETGCDRLASALAESRQQ